MIGVAERRRASWPFRGVSDQRRGLSKSLDLFLSDLLIVFSENVLLTVDLGFEKV